MRESLAVQLGAGLTQTRTCYWAEQRSKSVGACLESQSLGRTSVMGRFRSPQAIE